MRLILRILIFSVLFNCLSSCFTSYVKYNDSRKLDNNEYEFLNPQYQWKPNYTGYSLFSASILGVGLYSYFNPWYYIEDKKSPVASTVVGVSGVMIVTALFKAIFYSNVVKEGNEKDWLKEFNNNLTFISANYGKVLSSSNLFGKNSQIREVTSIRAKFIPPKNSKDIKKEYYDFDKMFYENSGK